MKCNLPHQKQGFLNNDTEEMIKNGIGKIVITNIR